MPQHSPRKRFRPYRQKLADLFKKNSNVYKVFIFILNTKNYNQSMNKKIISLRGVKNTDKIYICTYLSGLPIAVEFSENCLFMPIFAKRLIFEINKMFIKVIEIVKI